MSRLNRLLMFSAAVALLAGCGGGGGGGGSSNPPAPPPPVAVAPTITTQPASLTVSAGQTATFTVVADGTAPLSYQWQRNGVDVAAATAASHTTAATVTGDSGATFRVVVANGAGSINSASASLTVTAPPAISIQVVSVVAGAQPKQLAINFNPNGAIATIRAAIRPNDAAPYQLLPEALSGTTGTVTVPSLAALNWTQARIRLQACDAASACVDSNETLLAPDLLASIGYFKASNTGILDNFGASIALSADGNTMAIGAPGEDSSATGINGDQANNIGGSSGAVYVFARAAGAWTQQAYVKASNTGGDDAFGFKVALSADGNTLAVGALGEASNAAGVNGDQANNLAPGSGAVYVFSRSGSTWSQQAYLKASNTGTGDVLGSALALSADGNTLVAGAATEDSSATGVDGNGADNSAAESGAAYVFVRSGTTWTQQAYLKASNTQAADNFGATVAVSGDGNFIAVAATGEDSAATGINGDQANNTLPAAGAVYVFARSGNAWSQQAYVKASNPGTLDLFGTSLAFSDDGTTLAVGAVNENSGATGINGNQADGSATNAGAAYVFVRSGTTWTQQAYIKASNTNAADGFGFSLALSSNGNTLAIGAHMEDSNARGVNGDQANGTMSAAGAAYTFTRNGTTWAQQAYVKASNTAASDRFGIAMALSGDGTTLAVAALGESNNATGINGNQNAGSAVSSGAVYLY